MSNKVLCPECSKETTQEELDMFDDMCKQCDKNIQNMLDEDTLKDFQK